MVMLLWAAKFATAKIECSFEMASKHLKGTIYFAVDDTTELEELNTLSFYIYIISIYMTSKRPYFTFLHNNFHFFHSEGGPVPSTLNDGLPSKLTLKGIQHKADIGLLSLFEHFGSCKVSHFCDKKYLNIFTSPCIVILTI